MSESSPVGRSPSLPSHVPLRSESSLGCPINSSINFFVYGNGKQIYADYFNHGRENSAVHLSAAATAGVITAAATNPIWVVKTVMQLQQQQRLPTPGINPSVPHPSSTATASSSRPLPPLPTPPKAPTSTFSHSLRSITSPPLPLTHRPTSYSTTIAIFRAEGIRGFYKGLSASLLGVTEGTIQWTLYEKFKSVANSGKRTEEQGGWRVSAAAGGAKLVATMITYPHEVGSSYFYNRYLYVTNRSHLSTPFLAAQTHRRAGHPHPSSSTRPSRPIPSLHVTSPVLQTRPPGRRLACSLRGPIPAPPSCRSKRCHDVLGL